MEASDHLPTCWIPDKDLAPRLRKQNVLPANMRESVGVRLVRALQRPIVASSVREICSTHRSDLNCYPRRNNQSLKQSQGKIKNPLKNLFLYPIWNLEVK